MLKSWFVLVLLLWSGVPTLYAMDEKTDKTPVIVIACPQPKNSWPESLQSWPILCYGVVAYRYFSGQGNGEIEEKQQPQKQSGLSGGLPKVVSMSDLPEEQKAVLAVSYFDVPGGRPVTPPGKEENVYTGGTISWEDCGTPCGSCYVGARESK
jgi:hypothetical protein